MSQRAVPPRPSRPPRWAALGLACALLASAADAGPAAPLPPPPLRIEMLLAATGEPYTTVAARFETHWRQTPGAEPLALTVTPIGRGEPPRAGVDLVVTVGVAALEHELAAGRRLPLYATLVPRRSFEQLVAARGAQRGAPVAALWLDQPEARIARLTRLVAPRARVLGVLAGPNTGARREELVAAGTAAGLEVMLDGPDAAAADPVDALARLLRRADVLLALPDPQLWNRVTVEPLLVRSFRARAPVVAVSPSLVRSGAVAAVYATPEQTGEEIAERLRASVRPRGAQPGLPRSGHSARFTVTINAGVAAELGLEPPAAEALETQLRALEPAR